MQDAAIKCVVTIVLACLIPAMAVAEGGPGQTRWLCWYNNDATLRCILLERAADSDAAERAVKIAQPAPGAKPLPPNVREIIRAERALLETQVIVPLFSEPDGDALVEQLAAFSTCFGKADCEMTFWHPREQVAMLD